MNEEDIINAIEESWTLEDREGLGIIQVPGTPITYRHLPENVIEINADGRFGYFKIKLVKTNNPIW